MLIEYRFLSTRTQVHTAMGIGRGRGAPWIFIHGTDKVEGGLLVLFFGHVFSVALRPWKFFCQRPRIQR